LKEILPEQAEAVIVADREFHSIHLAEWIENLVQSKFFRSRLSEMPIAI